jgi:hypothetical protein
MIRRSGYLDSTQIKAWMTPGIQKISVKIKFIQNGVPISSYLRYTANGGSKKHKMTSRSVFVSEDAGNTGASGAAFSAVLLATDSVFAWSFFPAKAASAVFANPIIKNTRNNEAAIFVAKVFIILELKFDNKLIRD